MLGCSTGRNQCSLGMQGLLRGTVGQSMGTSSHMTCTDFLHSSLGLQIKHALCHVPNHRCVLTLHTQRKSNLFLHLQSKHTEQKQQNMVLFYKGNDNCWVLTKAGKWGERQNGIWLVWYWKEAGRKAYRKQPTCPHPHTTTTSMHLSENKGL